MDIVALQNWAYISELPDEFGPIRSFLRVYSKIPAEDIDYHIRRVVCFDIPSSRRRAQDRLTELIANPCPLKREDAWKSTRYPCIGRWNFLRLTKQNDPYYQQVLFRLKLNGSSDAFLDVGCCVGQVLRQLRHDGVQGSRLFGTDVRSKFVDIGYDLFQDHDSIGATFVVGDMLDPEDAQLDVLSRKVTIIYAGSFFHLFNWSQQLCVGKRLVGFLKEGTKNALIYGRHIGTLKPTEPAMSTDAPPYLHDKNSFQRLWREIGDSTRTNWVVEVEPAGEILEAFHFKKGARTQVVNFMVYQIF